MSEIVPCPESAAAFSKNAGRVFAGLSIDFQCVFLQAIAVAAGVPKESIATDGQRARWHRLEAEERAARAALPFELDHAEMLRRYPDDTDRMLSPYAFVYREVLAQRRGGPRWRIHRRDVQCILACPVTAAEVDRIIGRLQGDPWLANTSAAVIEARVEWSEVSPHEEWWFVSVGGVRRRVRAMWIKTPLNSEASARLHELPRFSA